MTRDTESVDEIVFECDFDEPPEKVWRALTERELLDAWMLNDADEPEAPREPTSTEIEVLKAEPNRLLRYACRERESGASNDDGERRVIESTVTFELAPGATGGTHVRLVHADFRITWEEQRYATVCAIASARVRRAKKTRITSCLATHAWRAAA
jgi:uncharacterized protein YndB with AHSA1/START domain